MNCDICNEALDADTVTEKITIEPYFNVTDTDNTADLCEALDCRQTAITLAKRGDEDWVGFRTHPDASPTQPTSGGEFDDSPFPSS